MLLNAVYSNGKFNINAVSDDMLKVQRVDGSILYDAFELSFNNVNKTRTFTTDTIDIVQSINKNGVVVNVYSKSETDIVLNLKSDRNNAYLKTDVYVVLSILQAGIDRRVLINAVDINGKLNINAVSNDILKTQKVNGSTVYDSFELSFNTFDKTSILKVNNVDMLASLSLKASASNVYATQDINNNDCMYDNALNNKADTSNTYLKTEIDTKCAALPA